MTIMQTERKLEEHTGDDSACEGTEIREREGGRIATECTSPASFTIMGECRCGHKQVANFCTKHKHYMIEHQFKATCGMCYESKACHKCFIEITNVTKL